MGEWGVWLDLAVLLALFAGFLGAGAALSAHLLLRLAIAAVCYAAGAGLLLRLARWRHRGAVQQAARACGLEVVAIEASRGFHDPAPLRWWCSWAAYDMMGRYGDGVPKRYRVVLTGALCGTIAVEVGFSPDEGHLIIHASEEGTPAVG
jgi:hypothetical protein